MKKILTLITIIYIILIASRFIYAGMAELADALDLESSTSGVQVRFLLPAPSEINGLIQISNLFLIFIV